MRDKDRIKRYAGWLGRRGGMNRLAELVKPGLDMGVTGYKALKPNLSPSRLFTGEKYSDGGIERFRELTAGLSDQQIRKALYAWERDGATYMIAGFGFLAVIPVLFFFGIFSFIFLISGCLLAIFCFFLSLKANYRAWQIRQGRVGSIRSYLSHRLPANMQIIDKDQDR